MEKKVTIIPRSLKKYPDILSIEQIRPTAPEDSVAWSSKNPVKTYLQFLRTQIVDLKLQNIVYQLNI